MSPKIGKFDAATWRAHATQRPTQRRTPRTPTATPHDALRGTTAEQVERIEQSVRRSDLQRVTDPEAWTTRERSMQALKRERDEENERRWSK